ncbi:hypothetical protein SGLAM104S_00473 [Streptomyces glaucescens]
MACVDTALRSTLDFAGRRVIFGGTVAEVPYSRRHLAESFAELLVADALTTGAVRSLQLAPAQASVWSSVVKYFVPTLLEETLARLTTVLGARYYLRGHPGTASSRRSCADFAISNFADGNAVNLQEHRPPTIADRSRAHVGQDPVEHRPRAGCRRRLPRPGAAHAARTETRRAAAVQPAARRCDGADAAAPPPREGRGERRENRTRTRPCAAPRHRRGDGGRAARAPEGHGKPRENPARPAAARRAGPGLPGRATPTAAAARSAEYESEVRR